MHYDLAWIPCLHPFAAFPFCPECSEGLRMGSQLCTWLMLGLCFARHSRMTASLLWLIEFGFDPVATFVGDEQCDPRDDQEWETVEA